MPRIIELIRASALPSTRMHAAARGALTVPPAEMIEILAPHIGGLGRVGGAGGGFGYHYSSRGAGIHDRAGKPAAVHAPGAS